MPVKPIKNDNKNQFCNILIDRNSILDIDSKIDLIYCYFIVNKNSQDIVTTSLT